MHSNGGELNSKALRLPYPPQKLAWTKKQLKQARGPVYRLIWVVGLMGVIVIAITPIKRAHVTPWPELREKLVRRIHGA